MADSNRPEHHRRGPGRPFPPGVSGNPGGRKRTLVDIERMLDEEHRNVPGMREVFSRLKALALGEVVEVRDKEGNVVGLKLQADPAFMKLYLERTLGPVRELDIDLTNASEETLRFLSEQGIKTN